MLRLGEKLRMAIRLPTDARRSSLQTLLVAVGVAERSDGFAFL